MARSVSDIYAATVSTLVSNFAAEGITIDPTTWSTRNIMRLMCYSFSVLTSYTEQLVDVFKADIETIAQKTPAASKLWIQAKMFLFQYSETTPQIVELSSDFVPGYAVVDPTLQIIKACSVDSVVPNEVIVKVAKYDTDGVTLTGLTVTETAAAQNYIDLVGTDGIQYQLISQNPDLIYIAANIYYSGQYSQIYSVVIAALSTFLQNLSVTNFDGSIKISDIEGVIKAVAGVNDVTLTTVIARPSTTAFSLTPANTKQVLVKDSTLINRQWKTLAGYCIGETDLTHTFEQTLQFIAE